jgi:transposase
MDRDRRISELEKRVAELESVILHLLESNRTLERENLKLQKEVEYLTKENEVLRKGKTSKNSSMPPSSDMKRGNKNRSLREKSGKKPGGQVGRKGKTLEMRENPDIIVNHAPELCGHCGTDLKGVEGEIVRRGQILDIPPIEIQVCEHRGISIICPCCGRSNEGQLPGTLDYAPVQYGGRMKSIISYLSVYQYMPVVRIGDLLKVMTGENISSGFIHNTIMNTAERLTVWYDRILDQIKASTVVFADETGCRIAGVRQWLWIWCTLSFSFISASSSRGYKTIDRLLGSGPFDFTLVSDRYQAQLKTNANKHQLCVAHLLRNCNELIDGYSSIWAGKMKKVLQQINRLSGQQQVDASITKEIEQRLDRLLESPLRGSHKKIKTFQKELRKNRLYLTTCLYHPKVPADNNEAERGIRNVKVKQKVSTGFRTMKGAQAYAVIRSIVDTAIKQGVHPLLAIQKPYLLFNLRE